MSRSTALILVLGSSLVAAACGSDDDWIYRPPGGGGDGDGGTAIDARVVDAARDDGGAIDAPVDAVPAQIDGVICPVDDLRAPTVCPPGPERAGVTVHLAGTALTTTSGEFGRYLFGTDATTIRVEVAGESSVLEPSTVTATRAPGLLIETPAVLTAYWRDLTTALAVAPSDTNGTIALYVDRAGAPATGVSFNAVPGSFEPVRYDGGGRLSWPTGTGTGAAGVALLFDTPPGTHDVTGTLPGGAPVTVSGIVVRTGAVSFIHVTVP